MSSLLASKLAFPGGRGIEAVPAAITQLQKLKRLYLSHISGNHFQRLQIYQPASGQLSTICRLSALTHLFAFGSGTPAVLPNSLPHLSKLEHLHLDAFSFHEGMDDLADPPALASLNVLQVTAASGQDVLSALTGLTQLTVKRSTFSCYKVNLRLLTRPVSLSLVDMDRAEFEVPARGWSLMGTC